MKKLTSILVIVLTVSFVFYVSKSEAAEAGTNITTTARYDPGTGGSGG